MPPYQTFPFEHFGGGLNIRDKPDAVDPTQCIDALNVTFSERGAIQPRFGTEVVTPEPLGSRPTSLSSFSFLGNEQILAGAPTKLYGLNSAFEPIDSEEGLEEGIWSFARIGAPNAETGFAGNGRNTLRKWNGVEWSVPTATVGGEAGKAMPRGGLLAVQPGSNRLAVSGFKTTSGGPNGAISSPSHVYFAETEAGPEAYEETAYVQLTPGDGERIMGMIAWKEALYVFKETKLFKFFGNTVEPEEGTPEFNYLEFNTGIGLVSPRAICASQDGIYFLGSNGIYRTRGQEPELISSIVEPIFTGEGSEFYTGGTIARTQLESCTMESWGNRIYFSFPTNEANDRTLIYSTVYEWWTQTDLAIADACTLNTVGQEELLFARSNGESDLVLHSPNVSFNDDGEAIETFWREGWFDVGNPDVKKIRASKAFGSGKVLMGVSHDFLLGAGKMVLLNMEPPSSTRWNESEWGAGEWSSPASLVGKERRVSVRGTVLSVYFFSNTLDQEWSVHRIEHLVPNVRDPAVITA